MSDNQKKMHFLKSKTFYNQLNEYYMQKLNDFKVRIFYMKIFKISEVFLYIEFIIILMMDLQIYPHIVGTESFLCKINLFLLLINVNHV